jgi:hypothetical protein
MLDALAHMPALLHIKPKLYMQMTLRALKKTTLTWRFFPATFLVIMTTTTLRGQMMEVCRLSFTYSQLIFMIHVGMGLPNNDENGCTDPDDDLIDIAASVVRSQEQEPGFAIELFPLDTAGAPMPDSAQGASGFVKYGRALGSSEEHAPFRSKVDWDIARWAKLHGPSSSAMTKLLEIDGVRYLLRVFRFTLTLYCSSLRSWASHIRISKSSII